MKKVLLGLGCATTLLSGCYTTTDYVYSGGYSNSYIYYPGYTNDYIYSTRYYGYKPYNNYFTSYYYPNRSVFVYRNNGWYGRRW